MIGVWLPDIYIANRGFPCVVKLARGSLSFFKSLPYVQKGAEKEFMFSKLNAQEKGAGMSLSLFGTRKKCFYLYLPLQGHLGCFQSFSPRKDIGVDNEQEDHLSTDVGRCSKINYTRGKQMQKNA